MSEEQLKSFLEKVKADTSLQEELKGAADADAVVSIAKEAGFSISADSLKKSQASISDEELESVSGGAGAGLPMTELLCGIKINYTWLDCGDE